MNSGGQWFKKNEATKTCRPYLLTFWCLRHFPRPLTNFIVWVMSLFYFLFDERARNESIRYQKILREFLKPKKFKMRPLRQVANFAISLVEKIDTWTRAVPPASFSDLHFANCDIGHLVDRLNGGGGAFIFISHLGNFEVLRSLFCANESGVVRKVPFCVLSDIDVSSNFSMALKKIAPDFFSNMILDTAIDISTIERLSKIISDGGLVVCAGDRVSKTARTKIIKENFLGRPAPFSYGAFVLPLLLEAPVYYIFGFKKRNLLLSKKFEMRVVKSKCEISSSRKRRKELAQSLCREYAFTLENFCKEFPYQWYNFFDFWNFPNEGGKEEGLSNRSER